MAFSGDDVNAFQDVTRGIGYAIDRSIYIRCSLLSRRWLAFSNRVLPRTNLPATSRIAPFGVEVEMPLLEEAQQVITLGLKAAAAALATNTAA